MEMTQCRIISSSKTVSSYGTPISLLKCRYAAIDTVAVGPAGAAVNVWLELKSSQNFSQEGS